MKNLYIELIKNTSNTQISFLNDVHKNINIDKRGKFKYFYISCFEIKAIENFISNLDHNSLYTIIPMISLCGKAEEPHLILSKQILISNYSDYKIINKFLLEQFDKAFNDFEFDLDNKFYFLIFKFKKVNILL
jgi:hypothetical protein